MILCVLQKNSQVVDEIGSDIESGNLRALKRTRRCPVVLDTILFLICGFDIPHYPSGPNIVQQERTMVDETSSKLKASQGRVLF